MAIRKVRPNLEVLNELDMFEGANIPVGSNFWMSVLKVPDGFFLFTPYQQTILSNFIKYKHEPRKEENDSASEG